MVGWLVRATHDADLPIPTGKFIIAETDSLTQKPKRTQVSDTAY